MLQMLYQTNTDSQQNYYILLNMQIFIIFCLYMNTLRKYLKSKIEAMCCQMQMYISIINICFRNNTYRICFISNFFLKTFILQKFI